MIANVAAKKKQKDTEIEDENEAAKNAEDKRMQDMKRSWTRWRLRRRQKD